MNERSLEEDLELIANYYTEEGKKEALKAAIRNLIEKNAK